MFSHIFSTRLFELKMCENMDFTLNFGGIHFHEIHPNCFDFKRAQFVAIALPRTARALKPDKSQKCMT